MTIEENVKRSTHNAAALIQRIAPTLALSDQLREATFTAQDLVQQLRAQQDFLVRFAEIAEGLLWDIKNSPTIESLQKTTNGAKLRDCIDQVRPAQNHPPMQSL